MGKVIVEIICPRKKLARVSTLDQFPATIGRSYDCDVVLSDPYVSPVQLLLSEQAEGFQIEEVGGENKVSLNGVKVFLDRAILHSGDSIRCGRTQIRIYLPDHPIPKTKRLKEQTKFIQRLGNPVSAVILIVLMVTLYGAEEYLSITKKDLGGDVLRVAAFVFVWVLVWPGIWNFIGKVFHQQSQYWAQVGVSAFSAIGILCLTALADFLGYRASLEVEADYFKMGIIFMGLGFLLYGNLGLASELSRKQKVLGITLILFLFGLFGEAARLDEKQDEGKLKPEFSQIVYPPMFSPGKGMSIDAFVDQSKKQFKKE